MFVSPVVLVVYIPMFIYLFFSIFPSYYILYPYFLVHVTPGFALSICVNFNHDWMKTVGGVCISISSYAAICAF